jgi:hypothetical protein
MKRVRPHFTLHPIPRKTWKEKRLKLTYRYA